MDEADVEGSENGEAGADYGDAGLDYGPHGGAGDGVFLLLKRKKG